MVPSSLLRRAFRTMVFHGRLKHGTAHRVLEDQQGKSFVEQTPSDEGTSVTSIRARGAALLHTGCLD
jgi:hypothetical protein